MACCGQKREALAASSSPNIARLSQQPVPAWTPSLSTSFADPRPPTPTVAPRPAAAAPPIAFGAVALRYLSRSSIVVRGPSSGAEYRFSADRPVQRVARVDRDALLRTGHFRLEG